MRTHKDCTVVDWPVEETESLTMSSVKRGGGVMGACSASEEGEMKGDAETTCGEVLAQSEAGANQQLAHCVKSGTVLSSTPERRLNC